MIACGLPTKLSRILLNHGLTNKEAVRQYRKDLGEVGLLKIQGLGGTSLEHIRRWLEYGSAYALTPAQIRQIKRRHKGA